MESTQTGSAIKPLKTRRRIWGIARGERVVISAGLAVAAIVLGVLVASAWWTLDTLRQSVERSRRGQAGVVGQLIVAAAETMLAENDQTTAVRNMVTESARTYNLTTCRIVLGDGTIIADADPKRISKAKLPDTWPALSGLEDPEAPEPGVVTLRMPMRVPKRGPALLELSANVTYPVWSDWEVQAGIGAIGAAAMSGLFLVYRVMRRRWRALGAVGDALLWEASGKAAPGALWVSEAFGPEAKAWNSLIAERDRLREQAPLASTAPKAGERVSRDGELGAALDALWQGLLVLDEQGIVNYANGAAGVLLKAKRDEMEGSPAVRHLTEPAFQEALAGLLSGSAGVRAGMELQRRSDNGDTTIIRATVRRLRRDDGAAAIIVLEDVTQQRVADESRNAFVAQATHELRTPLTNIRLYVETLLDDGQSDEQVRAKCLNVITSESRRLERIVGDMLSVAEIEAGALKMRPGDVRLDALLEELEADFKAQAEDKEIRLIFELPPKLPVLQADRDKLVLAIHNLIGNALKYTPTGGRVVVKVECDAKALTVAVTDDGIGIKEEEQELIFDRFYRAKDKRIAGIAGSGIGLSLARQIVRLHDGDITVKSQIDKGSTFTLTVPLTPAAELKQAA
ncbi:two-component system, OmpR family, sensor histidine kinase VicK [Phycisphaerales bacterium]|nr:two-component system, OmpR family, sensor histidine kinase VicK [Phycisphaerales bacterium]